MQMGIGRLFVCEAFRLGLQGWNSYHPAQKYVYVWCICVPRFVPVVSTPVAHGLIIKRSIWEEIWQNSHGLALATSLWYKSSTFILSGGCRGAVRH